MAGPRTETFGSSVCPCRYTLQETQKRETLLSPSRFPADHHACRFHAATPANVLRPVADRSEPPRRERHTRSGTGADVEPCIGPETTRSRCSLLLGGVCCRLCKHSSPSRR